VIQGETSTSGTADEIQSSTLSLDLNLAQWDQIENAVLNGSMNLSLTGDANHNRLQGNAGNNTLTGGAGSDTLLSGGGSDALMGGDGNDLFEMRDFDGKNTLDGTAGVDVADYSHTGNDFSIMVSLATGTVMKVRGGNSVKDMVMNMDKIIGTNNADSFSGDVTDNHFSGKGGNDLLLGNAGADTLIGGLGNDSLSGGAGKDLFVWEAGDVGTLGAADVISDFSLTDKDVLDLADLLKGLSGYSTSNYADYVKLSNGSSSFLQVDLDGLGAGTAVQTITLTSVNLNTDLATLVNNKVIVV